MLRKIKIFLLAGAVLAQALTGLGAINAAAAADNLFGLVGFAAMNGGTTGGIGGKEVTVNSAAQLSDLLNQRKKNNDTSPLIIKIASKLTGTGAIGIKEVSNISIVGSGSSGELEGVGLNIVKSSNIIVQNLKIHHTLAPTDCIGIESSKNIWIDHCELYNMIGDCNGDGKIDDKGDIAGGDVDWYDGLLDCKMDSAYITVSWNYLHDSFKTSLVGSSDSDNYDRKMTYHHNIFKNVKERLPSYRFGTGHIFSNYYADVWNSAVNSRMGAMLRVEGNYFERVGSGEVNGDSGLAAGPIGSYSSSKPGFWDVRDNAYVNCKGNQPTTSTCSFTPPYQYAKVLTPSGQVKAMVTQYAGVGKLDTSSPGGDTVCGDINGDGSIDTLDFAAFKKHFLGQDSVIKAEAADLDSDGTVSILDLAVLKKYLLGLVTSLPVTGDGENSAGSGDITIEPNGSMTLQQEADTDRLPGRWKRWK